MRISAYKNMLAILATAMVSSMGIAQDFDAFLNAPPPFENQGKHMVPVDFQSVSLELVFDVAAKKTTGNARIEFVTKESGYPFFDMKARVLSSSINGTSIDASEILSVISPDNESAVRVVNAQVEGGAVNILEIRYDLAEGVEYESGVAKVGFFMSDLDIRQFWEQYGPANFEFDQFPMQLKLSVINTTKEHRLYTNSVNVEAIATQNEWLVQYPDYFTSSSFFVHIGEKGRFFEKTSTYQGVERAIPVLVYSETESLTNDGMREALATLAENESVYGAFAHAQAIAYMTPGGGGMEYCGATMTSVWALDHEFTHFWFARGVMPVNGNSGWIDEAIASWRDNGYPRAASGPTGNGSNMGGFSPFRRHTSMLAYSYGARLISSFDKMFSSYEAGGQNGMRAVLRGLFQQYQRTPISLENFRTFIEGVTGVDMRAMFDRYVLGHNAKKSSKNVLFDGGVPTKHPRPYTAEEVKRFR